MAIQILLLLLLIMELSSASNGLPFGGSPVAGPASIALPPSGNPPESRADSPVSSPATAYHKHHHLHRHRRRRGRPALQPSMSPFSAPTGQPRYHRMFIASPPLSPVLALPPPPPNTDCAAVTCTEPLTYTPPGSPCGCVLPMQIKLRLDIAIYAFFPLVYELAEEIAAGVALNPSQVRIMGADAADQELEKTGVVLNLVPRKAEFDPSAAFLIYDKFWRRQVSINHSQFGDYQVLFVRYPGLPSSPPPAQLGISPAEDGPNSHGAMMKPLGVDISRRRHNGLGKRTVAMIIVSSLTAFVVISGIGWLLLAKLRSRANQTGDAPQPLIPPTLKPTGFAPESDRGSHESVSLSSGTMTYTGSAKIFSLSEIERATDNFEVSRVLGEGGFGLVYSGTLDDGREVAVKILKRDDQHGGREFLAEVEMLSRLHHRNLVKLIGICSERQTRCLVYELVPNGSVDSHLHGADKDTEPLDWDARMRIALGAARGLAYLHEDSNPRVIHRDFKSSNILLEEDYTPKVSDFGLARAALDGNRHISTHVMGTFGYLAPEYAMTGHLLVKSDVYSYGVVLLELLTGRKPVDLTQPAGQENLVAWARPFLTSTQGLETIIDPSLEPRPESLDGMAKVAAIASMCVQPEVAHRPFMGEVVQALKLVCSEFEDARALGSARLLVSGQTEAGGSPRSSHDFVSCSSQRDVEEGEKTRELLRAEIGERDLGSFRRLISSSGPLATGQRRRLWQRLRSFSWGGTSDRGLPAKTGSAASG